MRKKLSSLVSLGWIGLSTGGVNNVVLSSLLALKRLFSIRSGGYPLLAKWDPMYTACLSYSDKSVHIVLSLRNWL